MNASAIFTGSNSGLRDKLQGFTSARPRSLFGILDGLRAYRLHQELSAKTDSELQAMGLTRADLPRVAFANATR